MDIKKILFKVKEKEGYWTILNGTLTYICHPLYVDIDGVPEETKKIGESILEKCKNLK